VPSTIILIPGPDPSAIQAALKYVYVHHLLLTVSGKFDWWGAKPIPSHFGCHCPSPSELQTEGLLGRWCVCQLHRESSLFISCAHLYRSYLISYFNCDLLVLLSGKTSNKRRVSNKRQALEARVLINVGSEINTEVLKQHRVIRDHGYSPQIILFLPPNKSPPKCG